MANAAAPSQPRRLLSPLSALPLALVGVLAACHDVADPVMAPDLSAHNVGSAQSSDPIVVTGGFELPEAMIHDPVDDVYLVSNIGEGNPLALDGNGFISRVAPDGTILDLRWIDGTDPGVELHGPFGMALSGDRLYVVDRNALRVFDRSSGAALGTVAEFPYTFPHTSGSVALLNDVCLGAAGSIYVTDSGLTLDDEGNFAPTGTDAVYRIRDGVVTSAVAGDDTLGPNGCVTIGGSVVWTTFKSNRLLRTNRSGAIFEVAVLPEGQMDGLIRVGESLYLTSWEEGRIFRTSIGGSDPEIVISDVPTPGAGAVRPAHPPVRLTVGSETAMAMGR